MNIFKFLIIHSLSEPLSPLPVPDSLPLPLADLDCERGDLDFDLDFELDPDRDLAGDPDRDLAGDPDRDLTGDPERDLEADFDRDLDFEEFLD